MSVISFTADHATQCRRHSDCFAVGANFKPHFPTYNTNKIYLNNIYYLLIYLSNHLTTYLPITTYISNSISLVATLPALVIALRHPYRHRHQWWSRELIINTQSID